MYSLDLLLSLPSALSACILAVWLPVESVALLDSAYCNATARNMFLLLLQTPGCVLSNDGMLRSTSFYRYSVRRNIKLSVIQVQTGFELDDIERVLEISGAFTRQVVIADPQTNASLALYLVARCCFYLEEIMLYKCVLDYSFRSILQKNTLLTVLYLADTPGLTSSQLFGVQCPQLRTLCIKSREVGGATFRALLCISCWNLRALNISECFVRSEDVVAIGELCPRLHTLFVGACRQIGSALVTVSEKCTHIRNLELKDFSFQDGQLNQILTNLHSLQLLGLTCVHNIVDDDLLHLGRMHGNHLVRVSIKECVGFTSQGVCGLLKQCVELEELSYQSSLAPVTVKMLACISYTALHTLYLCSPARLSASSKVRKAICRYGGNLLTLGLCCHTAQDSEPIVDTIQRCKSLQRAYILGLHSDKVLEVRVACGGVEVIASKFPELSFVYCTYSL